MHNNLGRDNCADKKNYYMANKLSKFSKICLESFIDLGKFLINNPISYANIRKFLYGGAPDGFYMTFYNLERGHYLTVKKRNGQKFYYLTKKGKKVVTELLIKHKIKKQKWDKKWRILIFDVPENRHRFRDNLRQTLINLGFMKVQRSVWITPYNIIDDLYEIIPGFREGDWFEYVEAGHISSERKFKEYFGLK